MVQGNVGWDGMYSMRVGCHRRLKIEGGWCSGKNVPKIPREAQGVTAQHGVGKEGRSAWKLRRAALTLNPDSYGPRSHHHPGTENVPFVP